MTSMPTLEPDLPAAVPSARPPLRKRLLLPGVGLIALVAVGVYAAHWWGTGRFLEETDDASEKAERHEEIASDKAEPARSFRPGARVRCRHSESVARGSAAAAASP